MIPGNGPSCDLCTPDVHYLLTCAACYHKWDEPPTPGEYLCPICGAAETVSGADHEAWKRDVLRLSVS